MARGHTGLPKPVPLTITKTNLLDRLQRFEDDRIARERVYGMENAFRSRIASHVNSLPLEDAQFSKFNTNPFVLLIHAFYKGYSHVHQIERDILPAKQFSSMETSAGRMVEEVALPIYGWECVPSEMHSPQFRS